jgi:hypothetical protein
VFGGGDRIDQSPLRGGGMTLVVAALQQERQPADVNQHGYLDFL